MISAFIGVSGFIATLWYVIYGHAAKFDGFYNQHALILLLGAPLSVILISRSILDLLIAIQTAVTMTFMSQTREMSRIANSLAEMSAAVRKDGIGALAKYRATVKNPLFRDGVVLILSGFTHEEIEHNLTAKINTLQLKYAQASALFESLGKLAPGMGLLGTIVGLVQMMSKLNDPSTIGAGMAVSLLATLYGLILGNAVYLPLAEKISVYSEKVLQRDVMIMEGIILLKDKKSSAHLRDVLSTYSASKQRNEGSPTSQVAGSPPRQTGSER